MLKIPKNQGTTGYASKMANLLKFLHLTSDIRTGAEIIEDGLALTPEGSIMSYNEMRREYISEKISHYSWNDPEVKHLEDKIRQYRDEIVECATIIRRKNKEEKKEKARIKMAALEAENDEGRKNRQGNNSIINRRAFNRRQ